MILEEEESIIATHKKNLDELVDSVKEQMNMINDVDKPGSDIQSYVSSLGYLLSKNIREMTGLSDKIAQFDHHLKEEARLSQQYY